MAADQLLGVTMPKCINACPDLAEVNISWPTSRGPMTANFCGLCSSIWWAKYKNTPSGSGAILGPVKSVKEMAAVCAEYEGQKSCFNPRPSSLTGEPGKP